MIFLFLELPPGAPRVGKADRLIIYEEIMSRDFNQTNVSCKTPQRTTFWVGSVSHTAAPRTQVCLLLDLQRIPVRSPLAFPFWANHSVKQAKQSIYYLLIVQKAQRFILKMH
jgi:hypothetical protein